MVGRDHWLPLDPTPVREHPGEEVKVTPGRYQFAVADVELRWPRIKPAAGGFGHNEAVVAIPVRRRQPVELRLRHPQRGIDHPERTEQVVSQVVPEPTARQSSDQNAEHRERVVVAPTLS